MKRRFLTGMVALFLVVSITISPFQFAFASENRAINMDIYELPTLYDYFLQTSSILKKPAAEIGMVFRKIAYDFSEQAIAPISEIPEHAIIAISLPMRRTANVAAVSVATISEQYNYAAIGSVNTAVDLWGKLIDKTSDLIYPLFAPKSPGDFTISNYESASSSPAYISNNNFSGNVNTENAKKSEFALNAPITEQVFVASANTSLILKTIAALTLRIDQLERRPSTVVTNNYVVQQTDSIADSISRLITANNTNITNNTVVSGGSSYDESSVEITGGTITGVNATTTSLNVSGGVTFAGLSGAVGDVLVSTGAGTAPQWIATSSLGISGGGSGSGTVNEGVAGYFSYYPSNGTTTDDQSVLYTNGTNIGIGTTTPGSLLTVAGATSLSGNLSFGVDNTYEIGPSGANRPSNIYAAQNIIAGNNIQGVNVNVRGGYILFGSAGDKSVITSATNGNIRLTNNAQSDFGLLQLGGTTSAFPAIKRNGTGIDFRLADDSGYATTTAQGGIFNGNVGIGTSTSATELHIYRSVFSASQMFKLESSSAGAKGGLGIVGGGSYFGLGLYGNDTLSLVAENGGIIIGSTYASSFNAPSNGAIIQGGVGIGTSTPSAKLAVTGTAGSEDVFVVASSTEARLLTVGANGNLTIAGDINNTGGTGTINAARFNLGATNAMGVFISNFGMKLSNAGQIGWSNSSNWSTTLDSGISRSNAGIVEINNGTTGTWRDLIVRNLSLGTTSTSTTLTVVGQAGVNPFSIASSTGANLLTVTQAGNVGIGSSTPSAKLAVTGTAGTGDIFRVASSSEASLFSVAYDGTVNLVDNGTIKFGPTGQSRISDVGNAGIQIFAVGSNSNPNLNITGNSLFTLRSESFGDAFLFNTTQTLSGTNKLVTFQNAGTNKAYIVQDGGSYFAGSMGIGTTSPAAKLDVYGTSGSSDIFALSSSTNARLFTVTAAGNVGVGTSSPDAALKITGTTGSLLFSAVDGYGEAKYRFGQFEAPKFYGLGQTLLGSLLIGANADTGFSRNTAGVIEINNGSAGTWRDLIVRNLSLGTTSTSTTLTVVGQSGVNPFSIASSTGTQLLILTQSGNLGIGAGTGLSPLAKLSVYGSSGAVSTTNKGIFSIGSDTDVGLSFGTLSGGTWPAYIQSMDQRSSQTSTYPLLLNPSGGNIGIGTTSPAARLDVYGTAGSSDIFALSSSTNARLFTVTASGNVGVGTTTSSSKLAVQGNSDNIQLLIRGNSSQTVPLQVWQSSTGATVAAVGYDGYFGGNALSLGSTNFISSGYVTTSGRVQVYEKLEFREPSAGASAVMVQGSSVGALEINNGTLGTWRDLIVRNLSLGTTSTSTTLTLVGQAGKDIFSIASSTGANLLNVTQAGNVGVGSTSPTQKLSVVGNAQITGSLYVGTAGGYISMPSATNAAFLGGLNSVTSGTDNFSVGTNALQLNQSGSHNIGIGPTALRFGTTSSYNIGIGSRTLEQPYSSYNVAIGYNAFVGIVSGSGNVGIGASAGNAGTTGSNNTLIGYNTSMGATNLSNATAIGGNAVVGASNSLVLGGTGANSVSVGIGTTSPAAKLDVYGTSGSSDIFALSSSTNARLFTVTAAGNVGIGTANPTLGPLEMASGAYVTTGGTWTNASDRNLKENFTPIDGDEILLKISELPITKWNYKKEDSSIAHIGPVAQDFYRIFGLGGSDTSVSTIDPSGIALVGIQALYAEINGTSTASSTLLTLGDGLLNRLLNSLDILGVKIQSGVAYLKNVFADKVTTKELCIGDETDSVCVTKDQLKALLQNAGNSNSGTTLIAPSVPLVQPEVTVATSSDEVSTSTVSELAAGGGGTPVVTVSITPAVEETPPTQNPAPSEAPPAEASPTQ